MNYVILCVSLFNFGLLLYLVFKPEKNTTTFTGEAPKSVRYLDARHETAIMERLDD